MEMLPSKWYIYWNKPEEQLNFRFYYIFFIFLSRSLTSLPSTTQPVQLGAGDAVQDQSKAGPAVPASSGATNTPTQPAWNPFDDDNFSNLTAEEFKTEDKKANGKVCVCV